MKYRRCVPDYERLPEHHETYLYWSMITVTGRRVGRPPGTRCQSAGRVGPVPGSMRFLARPGFKPVPALPLRA